VSKITVVFLSYRARLSVPLLVAVTGELHGSFAVGSRRVHAALRSERSYDP